MKLRGGPDQTHGGVRVISTDSEANALLADLRDIPGPFGFDTETVGVDPTSESPAFRGRVVYWSLSWLQPGDPTHKRCGVPVARRAFLHVRHLELFADFLRSVELVGQNIVGFDMHVVENHGIYLAKVVGDTKHMSRLWYASKDVDHGLKGQSREILGYDMTEYGQFSRCTELKPKTYKTTRTVLDKKTGVWKTTVAGSWPCFSWGKKRPNGTYKRELIDLDIIERDYPHLMEAFADYASLDAKAALELYLVRKRQLLTRQAKYEDTFALNTRVWHPMTLMLQRMERRGMMIDVDVCAEGKLRSDADCGELEARLNDYFKQTDMNWGSTPQLVGLFRDDLRLPCPPIEGTLKAISKAERGKFPTAEASIYWLETKCAEYREGLKYLREWRKKRKLGQYLRDLPGFVAPDGRLHTVLSPEADTGRLSARYPALQQLPSADSDPYGIRRAFVAGPGRKLVVSDFSQLEVYILAHVLIKLFGDDSVYQALQSGDVYSWIARTCWPVETAGMTNHDLKEGRGVKWRKLAKILVLATNYGKTPMGLALQLLDEFGEPATDDYCAELFLTYYSRMAGVQRYQSWITKYAAKNGGTPSLLGRWRPLPLAMSELKWEARRGARQALNGPIQGGAQDVAAMAMLGLNTFLELQRLYWNQQLADCDAYCVLPVHDELIFDVAEEHAETALPLVKSGMENPPGLDLTVQLKCTAKVANNWAEGK